MLQFEKSSKAAEFEQCVYICRTDAQLRRRDCNLSSRCPLFKLFLEQREEGSARDKLQQGNEGMVVLELTSSIQHMLNIESDIVSSTRINL